LSFLTGQVESALEYVSEIVDHMLANMKKSSAVNRKGVRIEKFEVPLTVPAEVTVAVLSRETADSRESSLGSPAPKALPNEARAIWDQVVLYSSEAKVERALVYAVIQTESAFDPMATSHIPAYGLMQIVPESAGLDVTKKLFGKARILGPSYLYVPRKNIEAGATYLSIVYHSYLKKIIDLRSRLYCSIAAHNTGHGNVAMAFVGRRAVGPAVEIINGMTSQQVYDHLIEHLPHAETKRYLERVSRRMTKYEKMGV
jgi:membrane-bound lytic murein transglycosylase C